MFCFFPGAGGGGGPSPILRQTFFVAMKFHEKYPRKWWDIHPGSLMPTGSPVEVHNVSHTQQILVVWVGRDYQPQEALPGIPFQPFAILAVHHALFQPQGKLSLSTPYSKGS